MQYYPIKQGSSKKLKPVSMSKILQEIKVPLISVNDTSLTVIELNFAAGEKIKPGDIILIFESSKIAYDVEAETDGYIQYLCETGNDYDVNEVVALIWDTQPEIEKPANPSLKKEKPGLLVKNKWNGKTVFSEVALQLMKEKGIAENAFAGRDFINAKDVKSFPGLAPVKDHPKHLSDNSFNQGKKIVPELSNVVVEKLSANKKREIQYLTAVQEDGLTSTINTFIETDGIFVNMNKALKALKDSLLPVTVFEISRLLKKYRELNACYSGDSITYYRETNLGFAIDIEKGLKVLKIPESLTETLSKVEDAILDLSGRYLDDSLMSDDLNGITFTITDLSAESVAFFRPLINSMNSAILGISSIDEKLNRCIFSLTFDHRVTEGKLVARFLKELKDRLESYRSKQLDQVVCFKCRKTLEDDLSDVGFTHCITPGGEQAYICQTCLKGF
jgi:pyruvate/2-oxoglutarate dehydrogenase complex dihydrolipoamide acyltransferase (E2) component